MLDLEQNLPRKVTRFRATGVLIALFSLVGCGSGGADRSGLTGGAADSESPTVTEPDDEECARRVFAALANYLNAQRDGLTSLALTDLVGRQSAVHDSLIDLAVSVGIERTARGLDAAQALMGDGSLNLCGQPATQDAVLAELEGAEPNAFAEGTDEHACVQQIEALTLPIRVSISTFEDFQVGQDQILQHVFDSVGQEPHLFINAVVQLVGGVLTVRTDQGLNAVPVFIRAEANRLCADPQLAGVAVRVV
jgi:hypothetical protein